MQIENIALFELFMETVCEASVEVADDSGLQIATQITTLAQQLENCASIMDKLAKQYERRGEEKLALVTRRLSIALLDNDLLMSSEQESHTRLLDYVYPIV